MTAGARAQPVVYDTTQKKVYIGDMNDHQPLSWPAYQEGVDSSIVSAQSNPLTGRSRFSGSVAASTDLASGLLRAGDGFGGRVESGGISGATWQALYASKVPFYGVQIIVANGTNAPITDALYSVAATEKYSDRTGAWQGGSKTANFTAVTFGGSSSVSIPGYDSVGSFSYGYAVSDVIPIASLAPSEGDDFNLLIRAYKPTAGIPYVFSAETANIRSACGVNSFFDHYSAGANNLFSNAGSVYSPDCGVVTVVGVIFHTISSVSTILAVGDSISAGAGSISLAVGYVHRLTRLLRESGKPYSQLQSGAPSSPSADYFARARKMISLGAKPSHVVFPINTRNDDGAENPTVAQSNARILRAVQFAEFLKDNRIIPIIMGPTPENGLGALGIANYTLMESVGAKLAAACGGVYVPLLDSMSTGLAGGYSWNGNGYNFDAAHPNDLGNEHIATRIKAVAADVF